jgi:hypothetical protein
MKEITYPIIIETDNVEIDYFDSLELAASIMEPEDVEDGLFKAFDAEGKRLTIKVKHKKLKTFFLFKPFFLILDILALNWNEKVAYVEIALEPDFVTQNDHLQKALNKYFKNKGFDTENMDLQELIMLMINRP